MFKNVIKYAFISAGILSVFVFFSNNYIKNSSHKQIFKNSDKIIGNFEYGIVLGAAVYSNRISDVYKDRLLSAVEIYKKGKIKKIIISGDNEEESYNEIDPALNFLVNLGVKKEDIIKDRFGLDTYDSIYRAIKIFGASDLMIFTQEFHLNRAVYICKSFDIKCAGFISDRQEYVHIGAYKRREIFARVKALFDIILSSNPKYIKK